MKDHVSERVSEIAKCLISSGLTIRGIAKLFGVSKSTVHKDLTERIKEVRPELTVEINSILKNHKDTRHINGGIATKEKFEKIKKQRLEDFKKDLESLEG